MVLHACIQTPTIADIAALADVERLAWASEGANICADTEKLTTRIEAFPLGISLAMVDGTPAGSQYAFLLDWDSDPSSLTSWDDLTSNGWYNRVHTNAGNTGFLVGVGVIPAFRGQHFTHDLRWPESLKLSELLIARTLDTLFNTGATSVIGNARVPGYHTRPELPIDEYCSLRRTDGRLYDPVLRFHERMGACVLKPVEYSLDDAESLNAGCWVKYTHRF